MARVKKGTNAFKARKNTLKMVKGYRFGRGTKEKQAFEAIFHAGTYAFAHRRDKKGDFRRLWNVHLNSALRENGTTYSKFIGAMKKANVALNRKVLSELADARPETFKKVVAQVK